MEPTSPPNAHDEHSLTAQGSTLEAQLREMYGRVAYTHKTHEKMADAYVTRYKWVKSVEIALSALTSGSLLLAVFGDSRCGTIVGAGLSVIVLGLTLYFKEASLGETAEKHAVTAAKLWHIRETLLSLLTDMRDGRAAQDVRVERDQVNTLLAEIYRNAPRTNAKAYAAAQQGLKHQEELFFSDSELDHLLPGTLRKTGTG